MITILVALASSIVVFLTVFAFAIGPIRDVVFQPGQMIYAALPQGTAAAIFGYEGQGPHHYLWALSTVLFWWVPFAAAALIAQQVPRRRRRGRGVGV